MSRKRRIHPQFTSISKTLQYNAKKAKEVFDLVEKIGEGDYEGMHIIDASGRFPDEKREYRIYHRDGYCISLSKELIEQDEGTINNSSIEGFEYVYSDDEFDGFKDISEDDLIDIIKNFCK